MKRLAFLVLALVFSALDATPSHSQALSSLCVIRERNQGGVTVQDCIPVNSTTPLPTTGTFGGALPAGTNNIGTVTTIPTSATTTMSTAAPTAATFGTLLTVNASRKACLIQNNSVTTGYVYFGANGSATTANSFIIPSGVTINCAGTNAALTDNVAGTCASGTCAFVVSSSQ